MNYKESERDRQIEREKQVDRDRDRYPHLFSLASLYIYIHSSP